MASKTRRAQTVLAMRMAKIVRSHWFRPVLDCYSVAGESDYILQIVAADLGVLSESVLRVLTRIKGVANIRSNIVLNCVKSTTEMPLGHLT